MNIKRTKIFFKGDRILIRETGSELTALYLDTKLYCNRSLYSIKVRDKKYATKFLASLLNSRLIQFYYESKFRSDTELFPKIRIAQVGLLPIKLTENQKPFIEIVDKILTITKSSDYLENPAKKEEVKEYEKQIDQMVYKLYSLTPEEIEIVENSGKK